MRLMSDHVEDFVYLQLFQISSTNPSALAQRFSNFLALAPETFTLLKIIEDPREPFVYVGYIYKYLSY